MTKTTASRPPDEPMSNLRVGVDIGGTFTDIVVINDDGGLAIRKVPSTVENYAQGIIAGLSESFTAQGLSVVDTIEIRHGTTVASNAILEKKGARTGLIGTKGFRDVLEIRTLRMPRLYDLHWEKPPPLIERYLRLVVDERIDAHGHIQRPLDPADAERAVDRLLEEKVEAIAVCLLNAYVNPSHERLIKAIVARRAPTLPCCISSEVLPEIREYERTSTTVINAYVTPVVAGYVASLRQRLTAMGFAAPLFLMQSNGGLTTAEAAAERPMNIIESGPAAGVIGAQALARKVGLANIISFDMGGTTAKASLIENGEVSRTIEYQVGAGVMIGSRLLSGAGYSLKVPAIDLAEVGAGGGSIIRIDAAGVMQVGPESAGAMPGPACYDLGGDEPTITDANVVLGYIDPDSLAGGAVKLKAERARQILEERIAAPLGLPLAEAAYGGHQIAAANMIRAIKAVSTERGRDPRRHALFAFGGSGPIFAAGMARELGIRHILIPPSPGVFSSFGLLFADFEHHYSRSLRRLLQQLDLTELGAAWTGLEQAAMAQLAQSGYAHAKARRRYAASLHYHGQSYELTISLADRPRDRAGIAALQEAFETEHEHTYGHRAGADEPVELVSIRVIGQGLRDRLAILDGHSSHPSSQPRKPRQAYFGKAHGWLMTPIHSRADVATPVNGPAIVEEYDAACLIPPGARAVLDEQGNIRIDLS
jgi:N-methylhydantoinase A